MVQPLVQVAVGILRDLNLARRTLVVPVVMWKHAAEAPPVEVWAHTVSIGPRSRPRKDEPVVAFVQKRDGASNAFPMGVTVGRLDSNDVAIRDTSVSRFHAYFQKDERKGGWYVTDADSRNGTYVKGVRLTPGLRQRLGDDVELRLGDVEVRFLSPAAFIQLVQTG